MALKVVIALVVVTSVVSVEIPSDWHTCDRASADFNACLLKNVQSAITGLSKKYPEVGLPSLDPLDIPSLVIGAGAGAVHFSQNYKNVKFHGYNNIKLDSVSLDFNEKKMILTGVFPELKLTGQYDINGKILILPISGKGDVSITISKVAGRQEFDLEEYEKNGKKHFKVVGQKTSINPQGVHFQLDNLFNGDKLLGDNINKVMNDNWKEVYEDVQKGYEVALGQINAAMANSVFGKLTIDQLFGKTN